MSKTTIEAWRCDKCQWVWVASTKPDRCAKCKSRTWDVPLDILDQAIARAPEGAIAVSLSTADGTIIETRPVPKSKPMIAHPSLPKRESIPNYYVPAKYRKGEK